MFLVKNERFTVFFVPDRFMTVSEGLRFENDERLGTLNAQERTKMKDQSVVLW
jgi:hypothetical protein